MFDDQPHCIEQRQRAEEQEDSRKGAIRFHCAIMCFWSRNSQKRSAPDRASIKFSFRSGFDRRHRGHRDVAPRL